MDNNNTELRKLAKQHPDTIFSKRLAIGIVLGTFVIAVLLYFVVDELAAIIAAVVGVIFMLPLALATYFAAINTSMKKIEYEKREELNAFRSRNSSNTEGFQEMANTTLLTSEKKLADKATKVIFDIGASYALGKAVNKALDENAIFKVPQARDYNPLETARTAREHANSIGKDRIKVTLNDGKPGWLYKSQNGYQTLSDVRNDKIAVYNPIKNETTDEKGHVIGRGNTLAQFYR